MPKKAIDVSVYQGVIDWNKVKADGVEFAIIRGGLGDDIKSQDDRYFERNWVECQRVGIPCTMYLFSYATTMAHMESEVAHIQRLMAGKTMNCNAPIYIDIENTGGLNWRSITNEAMLNIMKAYKEKLTAIGFKMGIYSSRSAFWNEKMTDPWYQNNVSIWVAEYASQVNNFNRPYDIWQYSSSGSVAGINARVDMNWLFKDFTEHKDDPVEPTTKPVNITYQVYDFVKKCWLPNVVNRNDYAGIAKDAVSGFYISADVGNIYYRSRVIQDEKGKERWLPEVKNREDYAGKLNYPADGIMIRSDVTTLHYQVELVDGRLLPPVTGYNPNDFNNGYAGIDGVAISKLWVWADPIEVAVPPEHHTAVEEKATPEEKVSDESAANENTDNTPVADPAENLEATEEEHSENVIDSSSETDEHEDAHDDPEVESEETNTESTPGEGQTQESSTELLQPDDSDDEEEKKDECPKEDSRRSLLSVIRQLLKAIIDWIDSKLDIHE